MKRLVCEDSVMRQAVDGGATIHYDFRNNRGHSLFEIRIDKGVCAALA